MRRGTGLHAQHSRSAAGTRSDPSASDPIAFDWHYRHAAGRRSILSFIRAARARRTSRCCWCAKGFTEKIASLVDANQMSADGTVALDWWFPSDDGKYVAYGTSASGSENSTLHVIETATGKLLPDSIDRTRIAQRGVEERQLRFLLRTQSQERRRARGRRGLLTSRFSITRLGSDPAKDPLILGRGPSERRIFRSRSLPDDDDRWLLITVYEGWTQEPISICRI